MAKHFPGGGAQKDGEDPHFTYGKEQVYPGGNFRYHLEPFVAAIEAGVAEIMPYYGMPVGTEYEEVGFAFNK
ncbi:glycoside hydrolase family 3 protein, partial [Rhizobium johnstonii]